MSKTKAERERDAQRTAMVERAMARRAHQQEPLTSETSGLTPRERRALRMHQVIRRLDGLERFEDDAIVCAIRTLVDIVHEIDQ